MRSPLRIEQKDDGLITTFAVNNFVTDKLDEKARVKPSNDVEVLSSGLVLKSVGYMTIAIDDAIPLDTKTGTIRNVSGRVNDSGTGLYCSGWAAVGPSGVLQKTMNVSFEIGKNILDDIDKQSLDTSAKAGSATILEKLREKRIKFVSFTDWKNIDDLEKSIGERYGKPREKLVDVKELLNAAVSKP